MKLTPLTDGGLYAITDATLTVAVGLVPAVEAALRGGARMVQYRDKSTDDERRTLEARALLARCRRSGIPLIINDDVSLAARVGADGVHLGRDDASLAQARTALAPGAIIGVSCYHDPERARAAERAGADYVAFGRCFASRTKPGAALATPRMLTRAARELSIPVVAIGGITADNGAALVAAGARFLASIHGVFGQSDIEQAARAFQALFATTGAR